MGFITTFVTAEPTVILKGRQMYSHIKSAWLSKINWAQAVAFLAMLLTMFGVDLDAETQNQILAAILAVSNVATWIMRTWFTTTITPASEKLAQ